MAKQLKKGDKVEWGTSQGKTKGTVKKKLTSPMKIKGHEVAASKSNPEYLVESSKSGEQAAHKAEALKKVSKSGSSTSKKSSKSGSGTQSSKDGTAKKSTKSGSSEKKTSSSSATAKKKSPSGTSARKSSPSKPGPKKKSGTAKPAAKKSGASRSATAKKSPAKSAAAKKSSSSGTTKKTASKSPSKKSGTSEKADGREDEQTIAEFKKMMNIPAKELDRWLDTEESKKVGFKENGKGESVGHDSGRKILKILAKRKDRYTDEDVEHIHKVVGYVKRHLAQKPKGDISASNWRYSLMNWGHDPAK